MAWVLVERSQTWCINPDVARSRHGTARCEDRPAARSLFFAPPADRHCRTFPIRHWRIISDHRGLRQRGDEMRRILCEQVFPLPRALQAASRKWRGKGDGKYLGEVETLRYLVT